MIGGCNGYDIQETSLYCRPDYVFESWKAIPQPGRNFCVSGHDVKRRATQCSDEIRFIDFDRCLFLDAQGIVYYLAPITQARVMGSIEDMISKLMAQPRYLRLPKSYIHADDSAELRILLSKDKRK